MKRRGVAIIVVLMVLSLLAIIAWAVVTMGSGNLVHGQNTTGNLNALYAAEAGAWSKVAVLANIGDGSFDSIFEYSNVVVIPQVGVLLQDLS